MFVVQQFLFHLEKAVVCVVWLDPEREIVAIRLKVTACLRFKKVIMQ